MATIGILRRQGDLVEGQVITLQFKQYIRLVPNPGADSSPISPALLIYSGEVEIGAAWARLRNGRVAYFDVRIDDASLSRPINATLYPADDDPDRFELVWSR
jgi:uncharacterized protein (DUF736 family)